MAFNKALSGVSVELLGNKELVADLDALTQKVVRRIVPPAVLASLDPILEAAKAKVPRRAPIHGYNGGLMRKALGKVTRTYLSRGVVWGSVGVRRGFKITIPAGLSGQRAGKEGRGKFKSFIVRAKAKNIDPSRYDHLVEFGTRHSAAKPFLRPAYDGNKDRAFAILAKRVEQGLILHRFRQGAKTP